VCDLVNLNDNQVDCRPPIIKPNKHVDDTFCHGETLSLQASTITDANFTQVIKFKNRETLKHYKPVGY